jgi:hypothetical protein
MFSGGTHPAAAAGWDGSMFWAAYAGGKLKGAFQMPGQLAPGDEFTFQNAAGADLAVADDGFGLAHERGQMGRWWLHVRLNGASSPSLHWSSDKGRTWVAA